MKRTAALLAALAVTLPGVPRAEASAARLVLSGARSGSVLVRLPAGIRVRPGTSQYGGGKTFAGFYLQPIGDGEPFAIVGVRFKGMAEPIGLGVQDQRLPSILWRVFLLADGPATISIDVPGLTRTINVKATGPASVSGSVGPLPVTMDNAVHAQGRYVAPAPAWPNVVGVQALDLTLPPNEPPVPEDLVRPPRASDTTLCTQHRGTRCDTDPTAGYNVDNGASGRELNAALFDEIDRAMAPFDAVVSWAGTVPPTRTVRGVVFLNLPAPHA
jgi:hypothetical protein